MTYMTASIVMIIMTNNSSTNIVLAGENRCCMPPTSHFEAKGLQGPISWTIFPSPPEFDGYSFCSLWSCSEVITMKFSTQHDSYAVVPCVNFVAIWYCTMEYKFPSNWITTEKSCVKWAPAEDAFTAVKYLPVHFMDLFPFSAALFPNFGQAVILNFNCLSIDKEESFVLLPMWLVLLPTLVRQFSSWGGSFPWWNQAAMFVFQR